MTTRIHSLDWVFRAYELARLGLLHPDGPVSVCVRGGDLWGENPLEKASNLRLSPKSPEQENKVMNKQMSPSVQEKRSPIP